MTYSILPKVIQPKDIRIYFKNVLLSAAVYGIIKKRDSYRLSGYIAAKEVFTKGNVRQCEREKTATADTWL